MRRSSLSVFLRAVTGATLATAALVALKPSCAAPADSAASAAPAPSANRDARGAPGDVAAWIASPDSAGPPAPAGTLRQVMRVGAAGSAVRVRLSNLFGSAPLVLGPVHVALQDQGAATRPGTDHVLRFDGAEVVIVPPGDSRLSDPAPLAVEAGQAVTVSLRVPAATGPSTIHGLGLATMWIAHDVDATASTRFPVDAETDDSRWFVTELDVRVAAPRAIVVLGDSISDGVGSTPDTDGRWPDRLRERLRATPDLADVAVLDAGIAGNRIRRPGVDPYVGPSALERLDRDVLDLPGVRGVLLLEGINDLTASDALADPAERATAAQVIEGMRAIAARVHARGRALWVATLLPRGGAAGSRPHTPVAEEKRQAVNAWIRTSREIDGVMELELAMRDPAHPDRLRPEFDSGDHTHPNDAGHRALAAAIDLERLRAGL